MKPVMTRRAKAIFLQEGAEGFNKRSPFGLRIRVAEICDITQTVRFSIDTIDVDGNTVSTDVLPVDVSLREGETLTLTDVARAFTFTIAD